MTELPLAAIRFEEGFAIDALLTDLAASLVTSGWRVAGAVQRRVETAEDCGCADLEVQGLRSGQVFRISQTLGPGSQGCRLDPGGLACCAQMLLDEIAAGVDFLILNRFGKAEAEGRGFREVIGVALSAGIPVLTAVRPRHLAGWNAFTGGALLLAPEPGAARAWAESLRAVPG